MFENPERYIITEIGAEPTRNEAGQPFIQLNLIVAEDSNTKKAIVLYLVDWGVKELMGAVEDAYAALKNEEA